MLAVCPRCKGQVVVDAHVNECFCLQCGWQPTREITDDDRKHDPRWGKTANIGKRPRRKGIGSLAR